MKCGAEQNIPRLHEGPGNTVRYGFRDQRESGAGTEGLLIKPTDNCFVARGYGSGAERAVREWDSAVCDGGIGFGMPQRMTSRTPAWFRTALVAICVLAFTSTARAQEIPGFAKNGLYVGATGVPQFAFDGVTFNGSSIYQQIGGDEILLLPRLESKSTVRGVVGYRLTRGSFEVGFERMKQTATFMGATGEATFQSINFDERIYAFTRKRIQPYGLAGYSLPGLTVRDGSFLHERVGDGTYHGHGLNLEAGVTVFPHPRIGVSTGYRYRMMWFASATGVTDTTYELHPRFRETAGSLSFSAFVTF